MNFSQVKALLSHTEDKKYGVAIWIQIYLGLRVGELIALRWEDIDLETGRIHIRRTYVTKTGLFREYPKGGKHHSHSIPVELVEKLSAAKKESTSPMVVTSPHSNRLPYKKLVCTKKPGDQILRRISKIRLEPSAFFLSGGRWADIPWRKSSDFSND
ncbi:MAG: hypothetical protein EB078_07290 [Proteobacteria bacterium]|nr:hypothetical protein [Pseudomonadota bacterium]